MAREKYNLIQELQKKSEKLKGKKKLALVGQGDFNGANNVMRGAMNIKHHTQHLAIDNPEFPFFYDGKEKVKGEHSSFYERTEKEEKIVDIVKKYDNLLKGKCYIGLYFLYCKETDTYRVVERKEVENLVENYGFEYNNEFLDNAEVGEIIPPNVMLTAPTSYDDYGNIGIGVNGRVLFGVHPAVQDDAIIFSESFANQMIANDVTTIVIPISENTIMLNLNGDENNYRGLPNVGDVVKNGIICATRTIKETRMFSDLRDVSLRHINHQTDQVFYGSGEIIDINIYCNNPNLKMNKVNKQIIEYYNDARWFYTKVYKACNKIIKSGSNVDREIYRWKRIAMNYLDTQAVWSFNDNVVSNIMIEVLIRKKQPVKIGRKVVGRAGNKTVVCSILPDDEMPYLTEQVTTDQYGIQHPLGPRERVDVITNPLAIINRTIPMIMEEGSVTFILDRTRKHMATMDNLDDARDFLFDILSILNPKQAKEVKDLYETLSPRQKKEFMTDAISIDENGLLITNNGVYVRWEPFNDEWLLRDAIIKIYEKYPDIMEPYHIFVPKPKWGRDIYLGQGNIGYQYFMMLKQSGEKGFSVRSAGSISDEALPEKSHKNKIGTSWCSEKPIRFGEYETPNFLIITDPNDFALITALYRSSVDGRRFMYEAILSQDGEFNIPDKFTSRTAEILQVYLKSLGVRMETIIDDDEQIGEPEDDEEIIGYKVGTSVIFCTPNEWYYLKKLRKVYKRYIKEHPNEIDDMDELWEYILDNLPFKKKDLTDNIMKLFLDNIDAFRENKE